MVSLRSQAYPLSYVDVPLNSDGHLEGNIMHVANTRDKKSGMYILHMFNFQWYIKHFLRNQLSDSSQQTYLCHVSVNKIKKHELYQEHKRGSIGKGITPIWKPRYTQVIFKTITFNEPIKSWGGTAKHLSPREGGHRHQMRSNLALYQVLI